MITYKNLQDFIQLHKKELNKDSLVVFLDKKTNVFEVIRSTGNLNIDTYSFYDESGNRLFTDLLKRTGKTDSVGVVGIMGHSQVSFKLNDTTLETDRNTTLRDIEHNVQFDRTGFQTIESDQLSPGRFSDDANLVAVGFQDDYYIISDLEILHQPKYNKTDSWGHKSTGQYVPNILALVVGDKLKQKYEPSYNESIIIQKFEDFKNKK